MSQWFSVLSKACRFDEAVQRVFCSVCRNCVHIIVHKIKESTVITFSLNSLAIKISAELHSLFLSPFLSISTTAFGTTIPMSSLCLNLKWDFIVFYSIGGVQSL